MGVAYNNRFDSCVAAATRTTLECQVVGYKWAWISRKSSFLHFPHAH